MLTKLLQKSFFSSQNRSLNYPIYRRPQNYLNVPEFIEKFKTIQSDCFNEQVVLTGNTKIVDEK